MTAMASLVERLRKFVAAVDGAVWIFKPGTTPLMEEAADRITALEAMCETLAEALESIEEYWNRDRNDAAMHNACWYAIETAAEALTQYRAMKETNDG